MISQYLQSGTKSGTALMIEKNELIVRARNGTLSKTDVEYYLRQLALLFKQTPVCLKLAHDIAKKQGEIELAHFMIEKIPEELGHDQWARDDLRKQGFPSEIYDTDASPGLQSLLEFVTRIILANPANYLSYMYFVEYMTVLAGPVFLDALENQCGIKRDHMTALTNHLVLDPHHAREILDLIDSLQLSNEVQNDMKIALDQSIQQVFAFIEGCVISPQQKIRA